MHAGVMVGGCLGYPNPKDLELKLLGVMREKFSRVATLGISRAN